ETLESVVIQRWWPDSGRVTDVDTAEPQTLRPQPVAISECSDGRGIDACRARHPACQARRQQTNGWGPRGDEWGHVRLEHGQSWACPAQGPSAEEHGT